MHASGGWFGLALVGGLVCCSVAERKLPETSCKATYACVQRGDEPIHIDGRVDEAVWQRAQPMTDFGILRADKKAEHKTTARLLWDTQHLYIAFTCANDGIRPKGSKRDDPVWEGEAVETFLCPKGADAFYYEINFNPDNVIYDSRIESWKYADQAKHGQRWAREFNAQIKSVTHVQRDGDRITGWSVEAAVPFRDLDVAGGRAPAVGDVWLFNVFRVAVRADGSQELSHWQPVQPDFHRPHHFPRLEFMGAR